MYLLIIFVNIYMDFFFLKKVDIGIVICFVNVGSLLNKYQNLNFLDVLFLIIVLFRVFNVQCLLILKLNIWNKKKEINFYF